jgi:hypothetical protein
MLMELTESPTYHPLPLDGLVFYLKQDPVLSKFGTVFHQHFQVIICTGCSWAWTPEDLPGHLRSEHHFQITPTDREDIKKAALDLGALGDKKLLTVPKPGGPPVEGLLMQAGWKCHACHYCSKSKSVARNHSRKHSQQLVDISNRVSPATVQAFWKTTHKVFFAVDPELQQQPSQSIWGFWLQEKKDRSQEVDSAPPIRATEIPQLLRHTGWHTHLGDRLWKVTERKKLLALATLPKKSQRGIGAIQQCALDYLLAVREIASNCDSYVMKALHSYPV